MWRRGSGRANIYLWAGRGAGKTHLLQAVCNQAARAGRPCARIPLKQVDDFTPELFSSLEELSLVCLDDVDEHGGQGRLGTGAVRLVQPPEGYADAPGDERRLQPQRQPASRLPDLKSRLSWGLCYHLQPLDEGENIAALKQRARERGFELTDQVVEYLIRRIERDTRNLFCWLDRLDRHSLEAQRKLTVDFVKEILEIKA